MIQQLVIGSAIIIYTIFIQVVFFNIAIQKLTKIGNWLSHPPSFIKTSLVMVAVVLWMLLGLTINTWSWAIVFMVLGALPTLENALYFSTVTFTTLGFGDIVLSPDWRVLSSMTAVNGLFIFGLNTAFLVQFVEKTRGLHVTNTE